MTTDAVNIKKQLKKKIKMFCLTETAGPVSKGSSII